MKRRATGEHRAEMDSRRERREVRSIRSATRDPDACVLAECHGVPGLDSEEENE